MIAAVLDGFMAVITLAMIFVYSTQLALVVLAATVLYAGVRPALYRVLWQRTEATIQAQAQESSTFIEASEPSRASSPQPRVSAKASGSTATARW
jgi:ATP-binding cassette subfamily B protein RaxB